MSPEAGAVSRSEPMKITREEVIRIARLAHLRFSEEELERLRGQLDQILAYVGKLNELETTGVEPAVGTPAGSPPPDRQDNPAATLPNERALENAPESGAGHFKVPRVIP